jgi:phosphoglycerate kinase
MKLKTLSDLRVQNKLVLLRIDINSPVRNGKVSNNPRFSASSQTINELKKKKARTVILAHQGRKGQSDFVSLKQHAKFLKVKYIDELFNVNLKSLKPGQAILLKNTRAFKSESSLNEKQNPYHNFSKQFDFYINDAFSVSHRKQSSITIPPQHLPSVIGRQFEKEIKSFNQSSKRKLFILGGIKVNDYLPIFDQLKNKNNKVLAAGVLANLLLIAKGHNLGYENKWLKSHNFNHIIPKLKSILKKYPNQIILPVDFGLITNKNKRLAVFIESAPFKFKIFDIGPKSVQLFQKHINNSDYIFIKGPMGFSEIPQFSYGTKEVLKAISKNKKAYTIIGGGHLNTTLSKHKIPNTFDHISLSGGALIQYISDKKLPGIEALLHSPQKKTKNILIAIDRDGTILEDRFYYLGSQKNWKEKFKFLPNVINGIKLLNKSLPNAKLYMATNQSGVTIKNFPLLTEKKAHEICKYTLYNLKKQKAIIKDYILCAHADSAYIKRKKQYQFIKSLIGNCDCVKPKIGMIKQALAKENFSLKDTKIYVIGDRMSDVHTAHNAGGCGILIPYKYLEKEKIKVAKKHHKNTHVSKNFLQAAKFIIHRESNK